MYYVNFILTFISGKIMIDPYSKIEQKKCDFKISLTALNKVLKPLSFSSQSWDLVTVIGKSLSLFVSECTCKYLLFSCSIIFINKHRLVYDWDAVLKDSFIIIK